MPEQDRSLDHFRHTLIDDVDDIWIPQQHDHNVWITRLVVRLIESGAVHDDILCLLAPVCKVKVRHSVCRHPFARSRYDILCLLAPTCKVKVRHSMFAGAHLQGQGTTFCVYCRAFARLYSTVSSRTACFTGMTKPFDQLLVCVIILDSLVYKSCLDFIAGVL